MLEAVALSLQAQNGDDFGYDLGVEGETRIVKGWKLNLEAGVRTQDNARQIDRITLGATVSHKFFQTSDKKFSVKAAAGAEWLWMKRLGETDNKYFDADDDLVKQGFMQAGDLKGWNVVDRYWRNRLRLNAGITANYEPDKRWSFTLKETLQHSHYFTVSSRRIKYRADEYNSPVDEDDEGNIDIDWIYTPYLYNDETYIDNDHVDADGNVIGRTLNEDTVRRYRKDRTILRSKFTVAYDIKGFPVDLFASVDYGFGINYSTQKWKFTVGYDYKINKTNKLTMFYRYNTENDDDEADGHLVGLGYKFNF